MLGGDPNALYTRPRTEQAQIMGWWAASRLPKDWRGSASTSGGSAIKGRNFEATEAGAAFWLGG